ncbi:hypothetical protein BCU61_024540 [Vibrio splendidus]|uniref:hypothetical protein n=1 Tax=Vibrio splendidus TaxID=29497 RepID=UPI0039A5147C
MTAKRTLTPQAKRLLELEQQLKQGNQQTGEILNQNATNLELIWEVFNEQQSMLQRLFITRIIQAVRDNHSAVEAIRKLSGSELENGQWRIEAGEGIKGDVRADYDELNAKCRHLDRLLRGQTL